MHKFVISDVDRAQFSNSASLHGVHHVVISYNAHVNCFGGPRILSRVLGFRV